MKFIFRTQFRVGELRAQRVKLRSWIVRNLRETRGWTTPLFWSSSLRLFDIHSHDRRSRFSATQAQHQLPDFRAIRVSDEEVHQKSCLNTSADVTTSVALPRLKLNSAKVSVQMRPLVVRLLKSSYLGKWRRGEYSKH